jgi:hypothetical protein
VREVPGIQGPHLRRWWQIDASDTTQPSQSYGAAGHRKGEGRSRCRVISRADLEEIGRRLEALSVEELDA